MCMTYDVMCAVSTSVTTSRTTFRPFAMLNDYDLGVAVLPLRQACLAETACLCCIVCKVGVVEGNRQVLNCMAKLAVCLHTPFTVVVSSRAHRVGWFACYASRCHSCLAFNNKPLLQQVCMHACQQSCRASNASYVADSVTLYIVQ